MKKAVVRIVAALAITIGGSIGVAASAHATPIWEPHGIGHKVPNPVWDPH